VPSRDAVAELPEASCAMKNCDRFGNKYLTSQDVGRDAVSHRIENVEWIPVLGDYDTEGLVLEAETAFEVPYMLVYLVAKLEW
jgi:hypothetical protein